MRHLHSDSVEMLLTGPRKPTASNQLHLLQLITTCTFSKNCPRRLFPRAVTITRPSEAIDFVPIPTDGRYLVRGCIGAISGSISAPRSVPAERSCRVPG